MNGLDKIKEDILREAAECAEGIRQEAMQHTAAFSSQEQQKRDAWKQEVLEKAQLENKRILDQAASADRQERKQALLAVRSRVIQEVLDEAKNKIEQFPIKEYFDLLFSLFEQNVRPLAGKLYFAEQDYKRIPSDFVSRCQKVLKGGSIELCGMTTAIENGFLIVYGKIEQKCSIDSIFESNQYRFRDLANTCLMVG